LGFGFWVLGFGVWGVWVWGFRVWGLECRVRGSGFRVVWILDLGFEV